MRATKTPDKATEGPEKRNTVRKEIFKLVKNGTSTLQTAVLRHCCLERLIWPQLKWYIFLLGNLFPFYLLSFYLSLFSNIPSLAASQTRLVLCPTSGPSVSFENVSKHLLPEVILENQIDPGYLTGCG